MLLLYLRYLSVFVIFKIPDSYQWCTTAIDLKWERSISFKRCSGVHSTLFQCNSRPLHLLRVAFK